MNTHTHTCEGFSKQFDANSAHSQDQSSRSSEPELFPATQWKTVADLVATDSGRKAEAWEELARAYWLPLYVCVRHHGYNPEDAQDLVQGFFLHLLQHDCLRKARQERCRFHHFILSCLKRFIAGERQRAGRQKRGGGAKIVSLDEPLAEKRFSTYLSTQLTPQEIFEREWALQVVRKVVNRLYSEALASGKGELFEPLFGGADKAHYAEVARSTGTTEAAVKMVALRFRQRFKVLLHRELASMVGRPEEVGKEMHFLFEVLSR